VRKGKERKFRNFENDRRGKDGGITAASGFLLYHSGNSEVSFLISPHI